jgi:hypothetical protein
MFDGHYQNGNLPNVNSSYGIADWETKLTLPLMQSNGSL